METFPHGALTVELRPPLEAVLGPPEGWAMVPLPQGPLWAELGLLTALKEVQPLQGTVQA